MIQLRQMIRSMITYHFETLRWCLMHTLTNSWIDFPKRKILQVISSNISDDFSKIYRFDVGFSSHQRFLGLNVLIDRRMFRTTSTETRWEIFRTKSFDNDIHRHRRYAHSQIRRNDIQKLRSNSIPRSSRNQECRSSRVLRRVCVEGLLKNEAAKTRPASYKPLILSDSTSPEITNQNSATESQTALHPRKDFFFFACTSIASIIHFRYLLMKTLMILISIIIRQCH